MQEAARTNAKEFLKVWFRIRICNLVVNLIENNLLLNFDQFLKVGPRKSYKNIKDWFFRKGTCFKLSDV
ncbi:hypothetical protein Anas_11611 [Armadillidium nasatum]|uniref:Uncharacterized protein n=1 Tax=Armadillidium nasatum TaxID=96803 RepID=A0A5N5STE4_9CRUS|nr:hypothetical protein Anas_11611 [Armadillidium nasatum]